MTEPATLPAKVCLNCRRALDGPFCADCGQQDKESRRPFLDLMRELLKVVFELDGRAYRTVGYLLTRPGYLTREYFGGRRIAYTPPLRLFLVISIGFFIVVTVMASLRSMQRSLMEQAELSGSPASLESAEDEDDARPIRDFLQEGQGEDGADGDLDIDFGSIREALATFDLPFLSEQSSQNLQEVLIAQVEGNIQDLREDPMDFFIGSLEYLTFFMLLMMPLLAFIQMILFVFSGKYYIEHLVLTVHNHAFLILGVFLLMLLDPLYDIPIPVVRDFFGWLYAAVGFWIFIYLYLSLKVYFGRSHLVTGVLFFTTSLVYAILLSVGMAVFMVLLFIFA